MENVFVMLIIMVILSIAFVFVVMMQRAEQKDKIQEFKELEMIKKSQVLNFLPEMQCSENNNLDSDCYDLLKVEAFKAHLETDKIFYSPLLGYLKIEVVQYDPSPGVNREIKRWLVYDNPKPEDSGMRKVQFPVLLRDVSRNSDYFGIVYLEVYE